MEYPIAGQLCAPIFSLIGLAGSPGGIMKRTSISTNFLMNGQKLPESQTTSNGHSSCHNGYVNDEDSFHKMKEMRISRASKQYVFDEEGTEYLDCFIGVAHVGHCHPQVVAAGSAQMAKVATAQGFKSDLMYKYVDRLSQTLPDSLDTVYLCNSGSEANDLAIRLARQYTDREDIVVIEDSFHGNLGLLSDISPKMYQYIPNYRQKDFVHITPLPSSYRKSKLIKLDTQPEYPKDLQGEDLHKEVAEMCANEVERIFQEAKSRGRKVAAFICEPCMIVNGIYFPHPNYFEKVCKIVRDHGALVIFDETQTGLGRTGEYFWGFQNYGNVVPDIVSVGRPLGAGHPIGACITSSRIARRLGAYFSTFGGNPVSCAIGLSVLDVIANENLMSSVRNVGKVLSEHLQELRKKYSYFIGEVRGRGLVHGLEIITDEVTRRPNSPMAINIMYGLKAEKILVGISGKNRNVVFISPPMCFTMDNVRKLDSALDSVLAKYPPAAVPENPAEESVDIRGMSLEQILSNRACIAAPIMSSIRKRKKRAKMERNAHLFAVDQVPDEVDIDNTDEDSEPEPEEFDSKKAKLEMEEFGDID